MDINNFINTYLKEKVKIANSLDQGAIEKMIEVLGEVKKNKARIFFLGVGGGAGTGSHAANDFSKIAKISSICLSDNSSLLTALTNDEGFESIFRRQLEMHHLTSNDCLFIFSVGGGSETTSKNLVEAINYAKKVRSKIVGVVGKNTGATAKEADACIITPCLSDRRRTAHTEDFQMIMDHLLANLLCELEDQNEE